MTEAIRIDRDGHTIYKKLASVYYDRCILHISKLTMLKQQQKKNSDNPQYTNLLTT